MEQNINCGVLPLEAMDSPSAFKNIWGWLDENFEKVFLVSGLLAIIFLITFQTLYRYIIVHFVSSAGAAVWTEELARYIFIWVAFLGWVIASHNKSHIRISLVTDRAGPVLKMALGIFADLAVMVFALIFVVKGWRLVQNNLDIETVTLFFDFWVVYLIIPVSALATLAVIFFDIMDLIRGRSSAREIVL